MHEIVKDKLAVEGIGEDMHPMEHGVNGMRKDGWYQIDARVLSDLGEDNRQEQYFELIDYASSRLEWIKWMKIVVVCGAGQSRSNAIALGILVYHFKMNFYDAWELVKKQNPTCHIDPSHIQKLKSIFGVTLP